MTTKKYILILFISLFCVSLTGQTSVSDFIDLDKLRNQGIKAVSIYEIKGNQKTLIEKNELNNNGLVTKTLVYCNFFNDPTDKIEVSSFFYDKSDTLLIGQDYGIQKGDTFDLIVSNRFTYLFNDDNQLIKKRTVDKIDNDIEDEYYLLNCFGQVIETRYCFLNETADSIRFFFSHEFEYDNSGNLIKESFISDSVIEFERFFTYDSLSNLLAFNTKGIHDCGADIDRYKITYNSFCKPVVKEVWNARGENWAYKYYYDSNGKLVKTLVLRKYPKHKKYKTPRGMDPVPPPPLSALRDFKKHYQKDCQYRRYYDSNGRLIKVVEKQLKFKYEEVFLFEYE